MYSDANTNDVLATIADSHNSTCRVEVIQNGLVVATLDGTYNPTSPIGKAGVIDGTVIQDRSTAVRTTATLTLIDPDNLITPRWPSDPLQPYGQEVRIYRGIDLYGYGDIVYIPLGTLTIVTAIRDDSGPYYVVKIEAQDRGWTVGRRKSTTGGYSIASGTNAATAIQNIITSRLTGNAYNAMTFNFTPTVATLPALYYSETDDLWQAAIDLATSLGNELWFDRLGNPTMQPIRNSSTDPTTSTFSEGTNLVSVVGTSTSTDTYSRTIVEGQSPASGAAPVRATSVDNDTSSPTYYQGPFGDVPYFLVSPLILTTAQAQVVADALLRRVKGLTETVTLVAIPNPTIDAGDVVLVSRYRAAVSGNYVVETISFPLTSAGLLQVTGRKRP